MPRKKTTNNLSPQETLARLQKREMKMYEKAGIARQMTIQFPTDKIPRRAKRAMKVLENAGAKLTVRYSLIKK